MIYKFDILFKKILTDGRIKVVSYSNLLENPNAFGENENLEGAVGELSVVKDGTEKGFSLNSLLGKYHSLLVGRLNSDTWGKKFPLQFSFNNPNDVASIKAQLVDDDGYLYSSTVETRKINGEEILNLKNADSYFIIISKEGIITVQGENAAPQVIKQGETAFVMASTTKVSICSQNTTVMILSSR